MNENKRYLVMEHRLKGQLKHNKKTYQIKFKIHLKNWLSWLIVG
jgi:hypothetical protein